jgi:transcriptional regulator of arginine metabolism
VSLKAVRQRALADLLGTRQISSQARALEQLRQRGFVATQATVSRDLEDLGAVKVRGADGRLVYALPEPAGDPAGGREEVRRVLGASLLAVVPSGNLVVLRTPPGHAGVLASALDHAGLPGVAGTVAGDDTVLVVCAERIPGRALARHLAGLAGAPEPIPPRRPRAATPLPSRGASA